jgi:hypothetical protein
MDIIVLKSSADSEIAGNYSVKMNSAYSRRFLDHLGNRKGYCSSCGAACIKCRERYDLNHANSIVQVIEFPSTLPVMLDDSEEYLPEFVKDHQIMIVLSVHEEIVVAFIERFSFKGGIIIPIEEPDWVSPYARNRIYDICRERGVEIAFPKPFCSFEPTEGIFLDFQRRFRLGKPEIRYRIEREIIKETEVSCSAPCGATYYVAKNLTGKRVDESLVNTADSLLSAYPCTAGTEIDRDFGDSIIHRAVQIQRDIFKGLNLKSSAEAPR